MNIDAKIKTLLAELQTAVNASLSESQEIGEIMGVLTDAGCRVHLAMEIQVPTNFDHTQVSFVNYDRLERAIGQTGRLTDQDVKFLKSMRIKVENEK